MKIGDKVKCYHFRGVDGCYDIGEVVGIFEDGTFRAKTLQSFWQGEEEEPQSDFFTAPQPGQSVLDSNWNRVVTL